MRNAILSIAAAALLAATPQAVMAQDDFPLEGAEWVEVSAIKVDDGHFLDYANHLATIWRKAQDFAASQGWIQGYEILFNTYPREGEPDIYLLTRFTEWADNAESDRRRAAFNAHMQATERQMQAASAGRAEYRKLSSQTLLRRMVWDD